MIHQGGCLSGIIKDPKIEDFQVHNEPVLGKMFNLFHYGIRHFSYYFLLKLYLGYLNLSSQHTELSPSSLIVGAVS